ncbi:MULTISPECIES: ATP-binding protein [Trichocoleus]|uniref:ATP-binding protein n=1 Tax=Trichocoleus desertorum GB2-A4 TaxID=2933944 RepID=A0ABV0JCR6_9CYAN|nr:ATP-binding protein [Trichocoleus sp. FACHB-46]MBD1864233.1 ATP-binding protein [Trichocoleus sp. FACHB-46]
MSLAGKRSSQGDEYQLRIALHWLIRLLEDNSIQSIQVNSTGIPGMDFPVTVDDIVILFEEERVCFIQAKKNQTDHESWSLSDQALYKELQKACTQLESSQNSEVKFYSRSPFGEFKSLVEVCKNFPNYSSFLQSAPKKQFEALKRLSKIFERSEEVAFNLVQRIGFGPTNDFEDWDQQNQTALDRLVPRSELAMRLLERYLVSHETNLRDSRHLITRQDILAELGRHGLSPTPKLGEAEIRKTFELASTIGRYWPRTIDNKSIARAELSQVIELIERGSRAILLADRPGSGKTCLLLDLADYIEQPSCSWSLLFIKGDQFTEVDNEQELNARGLPADIVGQCARLASFRRVVVIIDSLDVLSLNRQHSALKVFLGLIDRLEKVDGLTVVAGCRSFDLQYDPLLRGRSWQHTIHLRPLDFNNVVKAFLIDWGIDPVSVSPELQQLLELPQNLRMYEKLAKLGRALYPSSIYELYDSFLEEVVVQNSNLGDGVMTALQDMAGHLVEHRSQSCRKEVFRCGEDVIRQLISQEVLWNPIPGALSFSHQTLTDCLIVRATSVQRKTLAQFILGYTQLPFIRPIVRAFFFFLRTYEAGIFRQQVWEVLSHKEIAYHIKRLVCQSLTEIEPGAEDWRLLRRIFRNYPDLFRRLLSSVCGNAWFQILQQYWLPEVKALQEREGWLRQFCWQLGVWANRYPTEVIKLWQEAILSQWVDNQYIVEIICHGLDRFDAWSVQGVRALLESLIQHSNSDRGSLLGQSLSQWVEATNSGDDLLWRYITKDISSEYEEHLDLRNKLRCTPHIFCKENFLAERLVVSDELLTLALVSLEDWSTNRSMKCNEDSLQNKFLCDTSWIYKHSRQDIHFGDNLKVLFSALEKALKQRAQQNDAWWKANEPNLRDSQETSIRYLLIQAYKENSEENISGIEAQLQDKALLNESDLSYELGELMQMAYPSISEPVQTINQEIISESCTETIAIYSSQFPTERVDVVAWASRKAYNLFSWIPSIFRTSTTQAFIDTWENHLGYSHPSPTIKSSGGLVMPPFSSQDLLRLSDQALLRLLHYYEQYPSREPFDRDLVGGFSEIRGVVSEACSLEPMRFLGLFPWFIEKNLCQQYIHALIEGISFHLRYRFSKLRPSKPWEPIEPLPEGSMLASALLCLLERYSIIWEDLKVVSSALEACCVVLEDSISAERLTLLLFWLRAKLPSDRQTSNNSRNLHSTAINSPCGIAAESAMILCNKLLEQEQELPELLPSLLHHFARDPAIHARVPVLERLPFLMYKYPSLGWRLLADVFQEPQPRLWEEAELCLYYQYREHFNLVEPYLERLLHEGIEEAGNTWGRLSALVSLAGYISQEQLFSILRTTNTEAWKGVAQVFKANLDERGHTTSCHSGLINILQQDNISDLVLQEIEECFGKESSREVIQHELALAFLNALPVLIERRNIHGFLEWLSYKAYRNPLSALEYLEILLKKLQEANNSHKIWNTKALITALNEILREADEASDPELIHRVINLQDEFLRLDISGIEDFFINAEQP